LGIDISKSITQTLKSKYEKVFYPSIKVFTLSYFLKVLIEVSFSTKPFIKIFLSPIYYFISSGYTGEYAQPLWFVVTYLFTFISFYYFKKSLKINLSVQALICFSLIILSYLLYLKKVYIIFGLNNLPISLFFVLFGDIYKSKDTLFANNDILNKILLIVYIYFIVFFPAYIDLRINKLMWGNYFIYILISIIGLPLSISVVSKMPDDKIINKIGKNSFYLYLFHWPILYVLNRIVFLLEIKNIFTVSLINLSFILTFIFYVLRKKEDKVVLKKY
jgi:fucose 4-O-acetylase-like acetyltransferase